MAGLPHKEYLLYYTIQALIFYNCQMFFTKGRQSLKIFVDHSYTIECDLSLAYKL